MQVQQLLASMADRGADTAVIEASVFGLFQGRLEEVHTDIAVLTGIGEDHIEFFEDDSAPPCMAAAATHPPGDLLAAAACARRVHARSAGVPMLAVEELVTQKMRLFATLDGSSKAVINLDDKYANVFLCAAEDAAISLYSAKGDERADVYVLDAQYGLWETTALIQTPDGALKVTTPLLLPEQMPNILAAIATALVAEVKLDVIAAALRDAEVRFRGAAAPPALRCRCQALCGSFARALAM